MSNKRTNNRGGARSQFLRENATRKYNVERALAMADRHARTNEALKEQKRRLTSPPRPSRIKMAIQKVTRRFYRGK